MLGRHRPGAERSDPFLPGQAIDLPTFLAAYTSGSAWINGLENVTGSIRPGLDANFAIVDADLAHIPAPEIGGAGITASWVRGRVAYEQT